jgi:penicillin-insensitive murein DD-endopeptidase
MERKTRMSREFCRLILPLFLLVTGAAPGFAQDTAAQEAARRAKVLATAPPEAATRHFGAKTTPAPLAVRAIGFYSRGCMAGARALAIEGETWQVMRTARNRMWGHPDLIAYLEKLARATPAITGWPGLLVGDISQARGGPMLTGHASHQIGLDADIWLTPMPARRFSGPEKENVPATNMVAQNWMDVDPKAWTPSHTALIRATAKEQRVARIFVNPAIKKALCREAGSDRAWLTKVRPMWGHNYHYHIRFECPADSPNCQDQDPPASGDGCGEELSTWLDTQYKAIFGPKKPDGKPREPRYMTLDQLPAECRQVLTAN